MNNPIAAMIETKTIERAVINRGVEHSVRSEGGATGIDVVAGHLGRMMKEELSERVETVYAEEYAWPLGIALAFMLLTLLAVLLPYAAWRYYLRRRAASA